MAKTPEQPRKRVVNISEADAARRKLINYDSLKSGKPTYTREELISAFTETPGTCPSAPRILFEPKVREKVDSGILEIEDSLKDPS